MKEIKESLGRIKAYYQRNDIKKALVSAIFALKNLSGTVPTEIRSAIRESVQLIVRDSQIKKYIDAPLIYQPGNENQILEKLVYVYEKIVEQEGQEEYAKSLDRKISLDKFYNEGLKSLKNKQSSEADEHFRKSLTFYKDEHHIFYMIAQALKEAGEIRRAYPYAKRGVEVSPESEKIQELFEEIENARNALT